jgi:4'-phosphopantetheinyl transferase EntD
VIPRAVIVPVSPPVKGRVRELVEAQRRCARVALALCAGHCGAPREGWRKGPDEAPLPNAGFFWSLSHKRQWAGAVIADQPVGLDLEHVAPRRPNLFDSIGAAEEWPRLGERSWPAFYQLWTAKESVLKANSLGIGHLAECRLLEAVDRNRLRMQFRGVEWTVHLHGFADHLAAVASIATDVQWVVLDQPPQWGAAGSPEEAV